MLRALLELSRISNLPTVWTNVIAASVIANNGWQWDSKLGWLLLGASLVYSAGMILNDVFDVTWDREHRPERPIPSGRMSFKTAFLLGATGLIVGAAMMIFLGGAAPLTIAVLVFLVLLYDMFHKGWTGAIIVMGLCRALLYLSVDSVSPTCIAGRMLLVTIAITSYITGLTLLARSESKGRTSSLMLLPTRACVLFPMFLVLLDGPYDLLPIMNEEPWTPFYIKAVSMSVFLFWTLTAILRMKRGGSEIGQAVGMLLAGIPLVDAMFIGHRAWPLAIGFLTLPPLLRLWQRFIAAT